ncbi:tagaturonate reductase [Hymenobacter chitinivorans]|uniref:Tagaturonate reductase n=1 Tax=Hymenobacter chitinivorans DSM 11115 TaxID=1121954 RepID=A0A2M9BLB2_9BACT|nr:tagaturonate reductase [Hymenobacter chitinivorans]PJJ58747.1 tagaturonate reductase [Hymenobacter chitinivorans DSM 11115]
MTYLSPTILQRPHPAVALPETHLLALPEKVLQFGTGVLLRGLPDYLIDKANRQGVFNGRIVVVKSTDGGDINAFTRQSGLYTLGIRGIEDGQQVEENVVCSAISRVLSAKSQWAEVLEFAKSPALQVVISNTTEVGIQLVADDVRKAPPVSFPGKLLAVLYTRWQTFGGDKARGLVIVPTELISDNGSKLEAILLELAHRNELEAEFIDWLETANTCCNSLVDRIVPGRPDAAMQAALEAELGYSDDLLTMSEVYRLWAIEGDENVRNVLSFGQVDKGVIIQPDINLFRELKLRLLNGTHTLSCGLAFLSGFDTVRSAMDDEVLGSFISHLMQDDLRAGIPYPVAEDVSREFGRQVLDRFRNPYIEHRWLGITLNYSAKLQMRAVATLACYAERTRQTPRCAALGFAAYLLFMRGLREQDHTWYGELNGQPYPIQDEKAGYFADLWQRLTPAELTSTVLRNHTLWQQDLTQLPGFADQVTAYLQQMLAQGAYATVASHLNAQVSA